MSVSIDERVLWAPVSGLYSRSDLRPSGGITSGVSRHVVETVRFDVDGWYPQMLVSGTYAPSSSLSHFGYVHWLATHVQEVSAGVWEGVIVRRWFDKDLIPHSAVRIEVPRRSVIAGSAAMTITFSGGAPDVTRTLQFQSPYFRTVEFEFDVVTNAPPVMSVDTWGHPERPSDLRRESLTVVEAYGRAGVDVQQSPNGSVIELEAGEGAEIWSDQQLHDAMKMFWSRYRPRAQWAMWMLFAHRHVDPRLKGIMFDNPERNMNDRYQRQGAAVFTSRIAESVSPGEQRPGQWLRREEFFATVHELGHGFNLSHSWQKNDQVPWVAGLPQDVDAESFMNYPQRVDAFFSKFHYRFEDAELDFIRHAPESFVEMGGSTAGQDHGFADEGEPPAPGLSLEISVDRPRAYFEFLEPVHLDWSVTNTSVRPQLVSSSAEEHVSALTVLVTRSGAAATRWRPYAQRCYFDEPTLLMPGETLAGSLFVSAGLDGWYIDEPGSYTVTAMLDTVGGPARSTPLNVRVGVPTSQLEDELAQDLFTDEVARALAFGGTTVMTSALRALAEVADALPERAVARHAQLTLALPLMGDTKVLRLPEGRSSMSSVGADGGGIEIVPARPYEAGQLLQRALIDSQTSASRTFGAGRYQRHVDRYATWLEDSGDQDAARTARAARKHADSA
jgi:hypothetical protein